MLVVSDTSPLCYLLLIGEIQILTQLYHQVLIPKIVQDELLREESPIVVQNWINDPPGWLIITNIDISGSQDLEVLDPGETAAILLAEKENANLIIIDDGLGRKIASYRGLKVTGLLAGLRQKTLLKYPQTYIPKGFYLVLIGLLLYLGYRRFWVFNV
ncbi:hypothetical protein IQ231_20335, partial [Cuspidothrix issatschenkoi LEGE 03284]|uniref:hypothetical protein n=1 Tax=Cuspidothrix issatschenkoi TaxID=230752 RepID=UPI00187E267E